VTPEEQIAGLRHFLLAGDLGELFEDIVIDDHSDDDDDPNFSFIQVLRTHTRVIPYCSDW